MLVIIKYEKRWKQVSDRLGTFLGKPGWVITFISRRCSADEYSEDLEPAHSWPAVLPRDGGNPAGPGRLLTRGIAAVVAGSLFTLIPFCSHGLSKFSATFISDPNTPFQILASSTLLPPRLPQVTIIQFFETKPSRLSSILFPLYLYNIHSVVCCVFFFFLFLVFCFYC